MDAQDQVFKLFDTTAVSQWRLMNGLRYKQ